MNSEELDFQEFMTNGGKGYDLPSIAELFGRELDRDELAIACVSLSGVEAASVGLELAEHWKRQAILLNMTFTQFLSICVLGTATA